MDTEKDSKSEVKSEIKVPTNLEKEIRKSKQICRILKTKEFRYHIGMTDKMQSLDIQFKDGIFTFFLDASPLDDGTEEGKEKNEAMLKIYNLNG